MAIYHFSIKLGKRSNGQSAIAAAAYRACVKLKDNETGLVSDFSHRGGVVFSELSLCEYAPTEYSDRETLWNAVQKIEKNKNAQLWREFEAALPNELSREEQIAIVRDFVKILTGQGMCVDWNLHDKSDGNPYAHIMATMRSITNDGKWAPKSRKVYDLDENGERIFQKVDKSGRKQYKNHKEDYNDWNKKERVEEWRAAWADCCNARLPERDRIDHRSYKRQGIEQEPTIHEGYTARKIAAEGKPSERVRINEEIRERNNVLKQRAYQRERQ
ncbi:MobQ family relaxase [Ruminococcus sp. YE78]|uniref:MobQ family relaxase n=1 Tax=Ruminococcus sp. YE78 TaxID=1352374 RepID=UPI00088A8C81|nr:MobQ family relaxase [Ruminococcus sp. YE78]SDA27136.1 MobA/MobL family protein [Ruminococcus sp. YE78]